MWNFLLHSFRILKIWQGGLLSFRLLLDKLTIWPPKSLTHFFFFFCFRLSVIAKHVVIVKWNLVSQVCFAVINLIFGRPVVVVKRRFSRSPLVGVLRVPFVHSHFKPFHSHKRPVSNGDSAKHFELWSHHLHAFSISLARVVQRSRQPQSCRADKYEIRNRD